MAKPSVLDQITAFNAKLDAAYREFAALEDHSLPVNAADREEHHRRGPCWSLAQAYQKALADTPNPEVIENNITGTVFASLAFEAIKTGF